MVLKYPLARLTVLYQLHGQNRSCEEAMINAAYEGGLISPGSLKNKMQQGKGSCGAIHTARKIAHQKMVELHGEDKNKIDNLTETIIHQIEEDAISYLRSREKNIEKSYNCQEEKNKLICGNLAPVILDLLIQQLRQH